MAAAARFRLLAPLLAISLSLSACGSDKAAASIPTIAPGKLIACTDEPYEPFEYSEGGVLKGIDVDLVRAMADDWELAVDFHASDFETIFDDLAAGKCDLVASAVSITDERKAKYLFTDGYFAVNQSLMVRAEDASKFGAYETLSKRPVAVQKGSTGADYVASHPVATTTEFGDSDEMTAALKEKKVDGIVQDFPINSYLAQKDTSLKVVQTFTDQDREEYGFVMPAKSEALRTAANKSLREIREDGRYDKILSQYLGNAVKQ